MTYIVHVQSLSEIMKMHINELASALALHSWLPLLHLGHSIDQCTPEVVVCYIMQNLCLKNSVACMSLLWFRYHRSVCILSIFFPQVLWFIFSSLENCVPIPLLHVDIPYGVYQLTKFALFHFFDVYWYHVCNASISVLFCSINFRS